MTCTDFFLFLLPAAITLWVAEELVVLVTPCPLSPFNCNRLQEFQTSVLEK